MKRESKNFFLVFEKRVETSSIMCKKNCILCEIRKKNIKRKKERKNHKMRERRKENNYILHERQKENNRTVRGRKIICVKERNLLVRKRKKGNLLCDKRKKKKPYAV